MHSNSIEYTSCRMAQKHPAASHNILWRWVLHWQAAIISSFCIFSKLWSNLLQRKAVCYYLINRTHFYYVSASRLTNHICFFLSCMSLICLYIFYLIIRITITGIWKNQDRNLSKSDMICCHGNNICNTVKKKSTRHLFVLFIKSKKGKDWWLSNVQMFKLKITILSLLPCCSKSVWCSFFHGTEKHQKSASYYLLM